MKFKMFRWPDKFLKTNRKIRVFQLIHEVQIIIIVELDYHSQIKR